MSKCFTPAGANVYCGNNGTSQRRLTSGDRTGHDFYQLGHKGTKINLNSLCLCIFVAIFIGKLYTKLNSGTNAISFFKCS